MGMDLLVDILLLLAVVYLAIGVIFGAWFVLRRLGFFDPGLASVGVGLRLILLPAAIGLWPIIIVVLLRRGASTRRESAAREAELQARVHRIAWMLIAPVSLAVIIAGRSASSAPHTLAANAGSTGKAPTP